MTYEDDTTFKAIDNIIYIIDRMYRRKGDKGRDEKCLGTDGGTSGQCFDDSQINATGKIDYQRVESPIFSLICDGIGQELYRHDKS